MLSTDDVESALLGFKRPEYFKPGSVKTDSGQTKSNAVGHTWVLIFWFTWPASVDRVLPLLFLTERGFGYYILDEWGLNSKYNYFFKFFVYSVNLHFIILLNQQRSFNTWKSFCIVVWINKTTCISDLRPGEKAIQMF